MRNEIADMDAAIVHWFDCELTPAKWCAWGYSGDTEREKSRAAFELTTRAKKVCVCDIQTSLRHYEKKYSEVHPKEVVSKIVGNISRVIFGL